MHGVLGKLWILMGAHLIFLNAMYFLIGKTGLLKKQIELNSLGHFDQQK